MRNLLHDYGWKDARRNFQSGGQGGGDLTNGPADCHLEVKHCERADVWSWLRQAEGEARPTDIPIVVCRCNALPWFAILPDDEWEALEKLGPPQRTYTLNVGPGRRLSLWKHIGAALDQRGSFEAARLRFSREGSPVYIAVPLEELLGLLRLRESA